VHIDLIGRRTLVTGSTLGSEERMNNAMDNPNITYAIHIATTPEKLLEALTSPEALKKK
jgi:hypothetical protein